MAQYIVKCDSGTFKEGTQPEGFRPIIALENRFFICESPVEPNADFVVEFPLEQQANYIFYQHPNGRRMWWDPFNGAVQYGSDVDNKNRRAIIYNQDQLDRQLAIMKWFMLNVWIPDKKRMYQVPQDTTDLYIAQTLEQTDPETCRTYIRKNLYYNL